MRMKVAFDVAQTCVQRTGCPWYADSLARALAADAAVDLELLHHFGSWCNATTEGGTRIKGVPAPLEGFGESEARSFWGEVARNGLPGRPDIVHSNCFDAPRIPGAKLVFTIYDLAFWLHPEFATAATHVACQRGVLDALERAAGIVFISRSSRQDFEELLPGWLGDSGRPATVLHGASRYAGETRFAPASDSPWLCVGSIEPRKNHAVLLDAYASYRSVTRDPRPLVLVGGAGWASDAMHARIRSAEGAGVRHLGYVDEARLRELYRSAFALIQPSWHEGFGLPVVEAMGFGLPLLCSDIPALREVAADAAGYFAAAVPDALTEQMRALEGDAGHRDRQSLLSRERSCAFSWQSTARKAVDFYRQMLQ